MLSRSALCFSCFSYNPDLLFSFLLFCVQFGSECRVSNHLGSGNLQQTRGSWTVGAQDPLCSRDPWQFPSGHRAAAGVCCLPVYQLRQEPSHHKGEFWGPSGNIVFDSLSCICINNVQHAVFNLLKSSIFLIGINKILCLLSEKSALFSYLGSVCTVILSWLKRTSPSKYSIRFSHVCNCSFSISLP